MHFSKRVSHALGASVALAMPAGCASGGSQMAPTSFGLTSRAGAESTLSQVAQDPRINRILALHKGIGSGQSMATQSFMSPDAVGKPLIFVATGNAVDIYLRRGTNKMVGQIPGLNFPTGLATDTAGNLYIANANANVLVYAPPYTGPPTLTLDDTGNSPSEVAVSPLGVVAVANYCSGTSCGPGSITFFAKNSTTPCATVADPTNFQSLITDAFDDVGDLYVGGLASTNTTVIGKIFGGCKAKKIRVLGTSNSIGFPDSIQIDKADRIAILDGYPSNVIDTYVRPKHGSLGNPVSVTPLQASVPNAFAFLASGRDLYTADGNGVADEYDYPAGGTPEKIISGSGGSLSVAVTPPLVP